MKHIAYSSKSTYYQHLLIVALLFMHGALNITQAQSTVSGTVTDSETEDPLPGVNIMVKGGASGTSVDAEGNYSLTVPSLNDTLRFSYVGYKTREIPLNGRTTVDVAMVSQTFTGEEITVVAYGQQTTETVTSSISSVSSEEISKVPASSVGNALAGQTTGLQIIQNSGQPGQSDPQIYLRGISSLSAGRAEPLYV